MSKQSDFLTEFYLEYLAWVEAGVPKHRWLDRSDGLCMCLVSKCLNLRMSKLVGFEYELELVKQFMAAGLNTTLPFNSHAKGSFSKEMHEGTMHLNRARIQWVKDHVNG